MWHSCIILFLAVVGIRQTTCSVKFEFTTLDWIWPNESVKADYIARGEYNPEACQLSRLKVDDLDNVYVTVPRLRYHTGVPASLNTVHFKVQNSYSKEGVLKPYPNWEMNKLGDCSGLQLPIGIDIDSRTGYLYVIDAGRVGILSPTDPPSNLCPAKIVVLDTRNGGKIVRSHEFPDSVVSSTGNFLNDIVLDIVVPDQRNSLDMDRVDPYHVTEVKYAYISDTRGEQIVVFDFTTNTSWSFHDASSMSFDEDSAFSINGESYNFSLGISGIAISPTFNYVYYSAIGSRKLWQIPTWVLRKKDADFSANLRLLGKKKSNSDALQFGQRGLYYGAIEYDAIYRWEIGKDLIQQGVLEGEVKLITETPLAQNWETLQWPNGLSLSCHDYHYLYYVTERAQLFLSGKMNFTGAQGVNFRIGTIPVGDCSYLLPSRGRYAYMNIIGINNPRSNE